VTFTNAATANTRASFSTNGVYVLRLTASDTVLSRTDDVQVTVNVATGPVGAITLTVGGAAVTGSLAVASEVDWYVFTAPTTGVYSFVAQALTLTGGTRVVLYGPNSSTNTLGAWSTSPTAFTVTTPGTYYLTMSSLNGVSTGSYSIRVVASQVPWVNSMWFDSMVASTPSRTVTVTNDCGGNPTEYMASESATFIGASWLPYSKGPTFTLSSNAGVKTVYFKVRNAYFESAAKSNSIQYVPPVMLTVGAGAVTGNVAWAGEEDWYQFTAAVTGVYTAVSQWGTMTNSCYVFVYGPNDHRPTFAAGLSQAVFTVSSVGTYYVRFSTWNGQGTGTYTLRITTPVSTNPVADLALTGLAVTRPTDPGLKTFTACSYIITNNGPATITNESVFVDYYLSKDATFGNADDRKIGDTGFTLTIPSRGYYSIVLTSVGLSNMTRFWTQNLVTSGSYYVFAYVRVHDGSPSDSNLANNNTRSSSTIAFTPVAADVRVSALSVTRPTDATLRSFTACSFTIANNGPTTITNEWVMIEYFISKDTLFGNADDIRIGDTGMTLSMSPGQGWNISLSGTGLSNMSRFWTENPLAGGNYYVFARAKVVDESPYDATATNDYARSASTIAYTPEVALTVNAATYTGGSISAAGDADWFSFTVTTAGTVTIDTLAGTLTDNYMYLYGPNNTTTLIESDDDDGTGYMARIVRSLAVGTYHVRIRAYYATGTGTYTIRVTR